MQSDAGRFDNVHGDEDLIQEYWDDLKEEQYWQDADNFEEQE